MSRFRSSKGPSGTWLVQDDATGFIINSSDAVFDYQGFLVKKGTEQVQNPGELSYKIPTLSKPPFVKPEQPIKWIGGVEPDYMTYQEFLDSSGTDVY